MGINSDARRRLGLTLIEVLVVVGIIVLALVLLIPAMEQIRGRAGNRATCLNKAHHLGLAMQNFASTYDNQFPPSADVVTTSTGEKKVGGYSFIVKLLPFMEYDFLYKSLPHKLPNGDIDAALAANPALVIAMNTSVRELVCPSNRNSVFQKPNTSPPQFAFTNFKAIGASTRSSLLMDSDPTLTPPYGTAKMHPDGALYPSERTCRWWT